MIYFVTGGAGFIGSAFIKLLLRKYSDILVVCIDCLTYAGNLGNLAECENDSRFAFEKADICDRREMERIFGKYRPDFIVNFAAETHVDRSLELPELFTKTNVLGTHVLLDCAVKYGGVRFHQISTDEVYGDLPLESSEKFTESSPLKPSSPYSASKAAADLLVLSYARSFGLLVTVSRCSNNYGPAQHPEKLIPMTLTNASEYRPVKIYGDGHNMRDWIFVTDHCSAVEALLRSGKPGEVYNIGADCVIDNLGLVKKLLDMLGRPHSLIEFVADRRGHDKKYALDSSKLRGLTGWAPAVGLDEGLEITVGKHNEHNEHKRRGGIK